MPYYIYYVINEMIVISLQRRSPSLSSLTHSTLSFAMCQRMLKLSVRMDEMGVECGVF